MWQNNLPSLQSVGLFLTPSKVEYPENFPAYYCDDLNILEVHNFILHRLEERVKKSKISQKISTLEKELTHRQSLIEKKNKTRELEKLRQKEKRLLSLLDNYQEEAKPFLQEYSKLGTLDKVLLFSTAKEEKKENSPRREYRLRLIINYLERTSQYYRIETFWKTEDNGCPGCGQDYSTEAADEFAPSACENCGLERKRLAKIPFSSENARDNINRNNYVERENFQKAMNRYEGKQIIPAKQLEKLWKDLDSYFQSYGLEKGEVIAARPPNAKGRRDSTSKQLMFKALQEKGYPSYYKNINLICHLYWGWVLPDLTDIREKLLQDYDDFQRVYEQMKTRKSCLNADYMLLVLLLKENYKCSAEDFKIVRTDEILEDYEEIRRKICAQLGWTFHNLL